MPNSHLSDPVKSFADFVEENRDCLDPEHFASLRQAGCRTGYVLQPWPIWLEPERSRGMRETMVALHEISRSILRRFFENDPIRISEFYNLKGGPLTAELLLHEPNGIDEAIYRGDFIETSAGFRCIEINAGTGMGGWKVAALAPLYAKIDAISRFLAAHDLSLVHVDTVLEMFMHFVGGALRNRSFRNEKEINLVVVAAIEDDVHDYHGRESREECDVTYELALESVGATLEGSIDFCEYDDLLFQQNRVYLKGRRVHAIFEQQVDQGSLGRQSFGSFKAGNVELYSGPISSLLTDKRNLALLSEHQDSARFSESEKRVLRSTIPWTRRALRAHAEYGGERVFVPELLSAERERLVLKHALSHSGKDVHLGSRTSPAHWDELCREALEQDGDWVVQEALESLTYPLFDGVGRALPHHAVWGLFAFGGRFRGGFVRVAPATQGKVISVPQGAQTIPFFEIDSGRHAGPNPISKVSDVSRES